MKKIIFLMSFLSFGFAHAGYDCVSTAGEKVTIVDEWLRGQGAKLVSKKVSDFYRKSYNVDVQFLESVIDPETSKYLTETNADGLHFALQADDTSKIGNMWGLQWAWTSKTTAKAVLMDMEGNRFEFKLTCKETPNLE